MARSVMLVVAGLTTLGCATPAVQPRGQLAELNHLFATVDRETADAIAASKMLRGFANLEVRTTTGTRASWTGRYLYGRQTYVEFFAPTDFHIAGKPAPFGSWGLALSGDRPGFNQALAERIKAAGNVPFREMETRNFEGKVVPWFEALTSRSRAGDSGDLDKSVTVWAMEYRPAYFELPEVAKEPAEHPNDLISRERYQSDIYAERMMRDISQIDLDVGAADLARIRPLLEAAGYSLRRSARSVIAQGTETRLRFFITPGSHRLRAMHFRLNQPVTSRVERIGRSVLTIGPKATATWTFEPPPL